MTDPAPVLEQEAPPSTQVGNHPGRMLLLISVGIFVSTFAQDQTLALLPLRNVLKNEFRADATLTSVFFFWSGFPWYAKPLFGILSDAFPLFGTRRKSYLVLSGLMGMLLWITFALVPHRYFPFLLLMIAANTALVVMSTVCGGLLVEEGQANAATGKLSSARNAVMCLASIIAGPIGGYLAARRFSLTAMIGAASCAAVFVATLLLLRERRNPAVDRSVVINAKIQLKTLIRSRTLLLAILFTFLVTFAPGFYTPLYFYQTDTLHFSNEFIGGNLLVLNNVFGIAGTLCYVAYCRRFSMRNTIVISILAAGLSALGYLHYHTRGQAMVVESVYGFATNFGSVMLFDLAALATPVGCEALAYSLLMSAYNIAFKVGDILGSWLIDHYHLQFPSLVWINCVTTCMTLLALPLLPRWLLNHREGVQTARLLNGD